MSKLEIETMIASQILQDPALLSSLTIPLDDFGNWEAIHCIRAVEAMERDGVKVTKAEVSRFAHDLDRAAIARIWAAAITRANFTKHVEALGNLVKLDKLENLAGVIMGSLQSDSDADEIISSVEDYLFKMSQGTAKYMPVNLGNALRDSVEKLEARIQHPGLPGVTTGYYDLNASFGGFEGGKLYYVGARPSQGKTALMLNFALHALSANVPIGIISVESNIRELSDRILSINGSIRAEAIRRGEMTPLDFNKLTDAVNRLYDRPGTVYHSPYATIADVAIQARRMQRNRDCKVIFIDYVQLISGGREWHSKPRHLEVAYVSRQLKGLASDTDTAIVCLAQIGRSAENKKPTMADFAESSALEKDADVMMAIHHEEREDIGEVSAIKVLKARDGRTTECEVTFIREMLKFVEA